MDAVESPAEEAGTPVRRVAKRLLRPLLPDRVYGPMHSAAKAFDIRSGRWSEPELELLPALLRPGETAVDVGANHGLYTFHLSQAVGATGRVHAFEPVPSTYAGLRRVVRLLRLSNVQLVEAGVADLAGVVEFVVPLQPSGTPNSGLAHVAGAGDAGGTVERIPCRVLTLDEFPVAGEVALLKCDVEGAELFALRGADALLARDAPSLLLEVDAAHLSRYDLTPESVRSHLAERGYEPFRFEDGQLLPSRLDTGNHLFVHSRRRGRVAHLIEAAEPS